MMFIAIHLEPLAPRDRRLCEYVLRGSTVGSQYGAAHRQYIKLGAAQTESTVWAFSVVLILTQCSFECYGSLQAQ